MVIFRAGAGMIAEFATAALLFSGGVDAKPPGRTRFAMAAALVSAAHQKRYEPPEIVEKPAAPSAGLPKSKTMPAPVRAPLHQPAAKEPDVSGQPRAGRLPAPIQAGRFAQAAPSNEDILRRLEKLEEENRRLRDQVKGGAVPPASGSPASPSPERKAAPAQMISGWRLSLYPWNAEGFISGDPVRVYNVRNQRFTGLLGQVPVARTDRSVPFSVRHQGYTNEMFVYKLEGWLHVTRPGTYQMGFEINCGFQHPCNFSVKLGDQRLFSERHQNFENKILFQGRELPVGDYRIEVTFNIANQKFMKFDPRRMSVFPQVRGPGEFNFRDFGPQELLTEANASIPSGPPR